VSYISGSAIFSSISKGHSLESSGYPWVIEGKVVDFSRNMPKQVVQQHRRFQVCLQCIILSVGHYPFYGSPDLTLIKASLDWFFLEGFPMGLPKNIGVLMCLI
jgi:hypothetical protein